MPARLIPLSDDGIDPGCGDDLPLLGIRRRRKEHDPGGAEGLDPIKGRYAEVEADDRGAFRQQGVELGVVGQKGLIDFRQAVRWSRAVSGEIGLEPGEPRCLAGGIRDARLVAEHVDLERTPGPGPNCGDHLAGGVGVNRPDPNGAEPTGVRDCGSHLRRRHAGHRSLDDRQLDSELADEWVHGVSPSELRISYPRSSGGGTPLISRIREHRGIVRRARVDHCFPSRIARPGRTGFGSPPSMTAIPLTNR
jgi:hypothetical protein